MKSDRDIVGELQDAWEKFLEIKREAEGRNMEIKILTVEWPRLGTWKLEVTKRMLW